MTVRPSDVAPDALNILVLGMNFSPEPTGIAPYTSAMADGLAARGMHVSVLTTFPHYPEWRIHNGYSGWSMCEPGPPSVRRLKHYVPSRPRGVLRAVSELSFGVRSVATGWHGPDVVLCVSPALLATALATARATMSKRRPAIGIVVQDLYSAGMVEMRGADLFSRGITAIERRSLAAADGVAVIHDRFKDRVVDHLDVERDRVRVIRNWTHVAAAPSVLRPSIRERMGWRYDELIVLHTGAMGEKQALANVVDAARMADSARVPARFVLMGDGGQRRELEDRARGVRRLDFLDPVLGTDYPAILDAADLLLVNERPGMIETAVPSKLTSYFSSGKPVLAATDASSTTAEEIAASGAGLRIDPGSPVALLEAVVALWRDESRRTALGAAGPAYCATVLSEGAALDAYADWVRTLASSRTERD